MLGRQFSPSQKCNVALIIPGGYCSVLPFVLGMSEVWVPPVIAMASLTPLPGGEKMARPRARHGLRWAKKERVAHSVTYISVVLVASLLEVTWVLGCPESPLMANPSRFLPPVGS